MRDSVGDDTHTHTHTHLYTIFLLSFLFFFFFHILFADSVHAVPVQRDPRERDCSGASRD